MVHTASALSSRHIWAPSPTGSEPASFRVGTWIRDFSLLGAGIGLLAPQVMLLPLVMFGFPVFIPLGLAATCAFLGALLGVGVGLLMCGASWVARDYPLALFWLGFPVGALAGWLVGTPIEMALTGSGVEIGRLGLVTGGLVLGFVWVPYLALRLRGRSGLAAVVTGILASPVMAVIATFSMFLLA